MRYLPAAGFPTSVHRLVSAASQSGSARRRPQVLDQARAALQQMFGRPTFALVDSGTSALRLAIEFAQHRRVGPIAVPAYTCIDVPTAVLAASGVAIPYDVDPSTLAPVADSVASALASGASAVVVAHLFGHPVDLSPLIAQCQRASALLIEDAAQSGAGRIAQEPLGTRGDLSVLSFGRGKGMCGTGGGALLGSPRLSDDWDAWWASRCAAHIVRTEGRGEWVRRALSALAAALLSRPMVYAIPASIPSLRLGQMVYHPPHPVAEISTLTASLLPAALADANAQRDARAERAARLRRAIEGLGVGIVPSAPNNAEPGWLRLPLLLSRSRHLPAHLGVVRPYPHPLSRQTEVAEVIRTVPHTPGAEHLAERLVSLPTHSAVTIRDEHALMRWLQSRDEPPDVLQGDS